MAIQTIYGMDYKKSLHLYVLQRDYVSERLAITLEDVLSDDNSTGIDAVVKAFLTRCSTVLYDYIYSFNPKFKKYKQYMLCHNKEWAEAVREMLLDMVMYHVLNGLDSTILNPLLNTSPESRVPVLTDEQIRQAAIPEGVKQKVKNMGWNIVWYNFNFDEKLLDDYANEELLIAEI